MKNILLLILLFLNVSVTMAQSVDLRLLEHINSPSTAGDGTWRTISNSAMYIDAVAPIGMFVTGFLNHDPGMRTKAYETAAAEVITDGATFILKRVIDRQRPYLTYPNLITGKTTETDPSFPSGHASVTFAMATSLSLSFPKWYVIAPSFLYAGTVSYSRLYLGVHYPSDVLAGAALGTATAWLTFKAQKWLVHKKQTHAKEN